MLGDQGSTGRNPKIIPALVLVLPVLIVGPKLEPNEVFGGGVLIWVVAVTLRNEDGGIGIGRVEFEWKIEVGFL